MFWNVLWKNKAEEHEPAQSDLDPAVKSSPTFLRAIVNHFSVNRALKLAEQVKYDLAHKDNVHYRNDYKHSTETLPLTPEEEKAVKSTMSMLQLTWVRDCLLQYDLLTSIRFTIDGVEYTRSMYSCNAFKSEYYQETDMFKVMQNDELVLAENACDAHYDRTVREAIGDALMRVQNPPTTYDQTPPSYFEYCVKKRMLVRSEQFFRWRSNCLPPIYLWCEKHKKVVEF